MLVHASHTARLVITSLLLITATGGCGTKHVAVEPSVMTSLAQSKLAVIHYDPEPFMMWTGEQKARSIALGLLFGMIGGAIDGGLQMADAKEAGAQFISQTQLIDPIRQVQSRFLPAWSKELGLDTLPPLQLADDDDVDALKKQIGSGYVLDFKTEGWMIQIMPRMSFASEPPGYRTVYAARVRLIHLDDESVVWQETCEFDRNSSLTPILKRADLDGADNGEAAKASLHTLATNCADYLWRRFFQRATGPDTQEPVQGTTVFSR